MKKQNTDSGNNQLFYQFKKIVKNQDELAPTINSELHFDGNEDQKTHLGGVLTLFAKLVMAYFVLIGARKTVLCINPYISTLEVDIAESSVVMNIS